MARYSVLGSNRSNSHANDKAKIGSSPGNRKIMKKTSNLGTNFNTKITSSPSSRKKMKQAPLTSYLSSAKAQLNKSKEFISVGSDENSNSTTPEDCSINCVSPVNNYDQVKSYNEDVEMASSSPIRKEETPSKMCDFRICVDLFSSRGDYDEAALTVGSNQSDESLNEYSSTDNIPSDANDENGDIESVSNQDSGTSIPTKRCIENDDIDQPKKKKAKKDAEAKKQEKLKEAEAKKREKLLKELEDKEAKDRKRRLKKEKRLQIEKEKKRIAEENRQKKQEEKRQLKEQKRLEQEEEKKRIAEEKRKRRESKEETLRLEKEQKLKERQTRLEIKREQLAKEKEEKRIMKDKMRQEKQEAKDKEIEEKRKQKEQDKLARQEEKRKKEEEKQKLENEELRKKQKERDTFAKFFIKAPKPESTKIVQAQGMSRFPAFELKPGMTLARPTSAVMSDSTEFDQYLEKQDFNGMFYLEELRKRKLKARRVCRSLRTNSKDINNDGSHMVAKYATNGQVFLVRDSKSSSTLNEAVVEVGAKEEVQFKRQEMLVVKFLQFHDNYRPAYFGTWRKRSKKICARNPWRKDEILLNYEYDSDEDWEEDDPGESLSQSENEAESDEDEDDDDGFFVPHGYLSADEGVCSDENEDNNEGKNVPHASKSKTWEADMQRKCKPLQPLIIGCLWLDDETSHYVLESCACKPLIDLPINPDVQDTKPAKLDEKLNVDQNNTKNGNSPVTRRGRGTKEGRVPEEALPDLIKFIHGSKNSLQKLIEEFRDFWYRKQNESGLNADPDSGSVTTVQSAEDTPNFDSPKRKSSEISNSTDIINDSNKVSPKSNEIESVAISKRQLEVKILSMAQKERRDSDVKLHWYVNDNVLESFGLLEWSRTRDRTNDGDSTPRVYRKKKKP